MLNYFCTILCIFFALTVQSQSKYAFGIEGRFKTGILLGHRPVMGHLAQNHAFAGELSLFVRTEGKKKWHSAYKYPDFGVTLFGGTAGNNEILGYFFGLNSFLSVPFVAKSKFRLNGKVSAGLGFGTKQYDPLTNPKNVAMSTPVNAMICFGIDAKYYMKQNWVSLGIDMTHFSNGGFKVPNLGVNLPFLSLAYGRFLRKPQIDSLGVKKETTMPFRKIFFGATAILSAKEVFPTGGKKYPVYALNIHARTFLRPRVGWEIAIDLISKQALFGYRPQIEKTQKDIFQIGAYAGYLLPLDQFHFVLGMGYYVRDKYQADDGLYHRVGFRYYLKNGIHFNLVLKSHWAKADYVEYGIGYSFNTKK